MNHRARIMGPGLLMGLLLAASAGCQAIPEAATGGAERVTRKPDGAFPIKAVDLNALPDLAAVIPQLAERRVVMVGETHDRYEHHLVQLEIIRRLHALNPNLVLGLEFFQQPFQPHLDAYIAGRIDEAQMLRETEYFDRWRFDYRLYRPILQFAREKKIPVLALNVPAELTRKVAKGGVAGLSAQERAGLPEIDRSDVAYRERLRRVFEMHPDPESGNFDHFVEAQLLWDEGMAAQAADYLREHPSTPMVILAGAGHLAYGSGIPSRLERRIGSAPAVVLNDTNNGIGPEVADFMLLAPPRPLPPAGRLGAYLDEKGGRIAIDGFDGESAGKKAGLETGDVITAIDGAPIRSMADLRIAMLDKAPADTVEVEVRRAAWLAGTEQLRFTVALQE